MSNNYRRRRARLVAAAAGSCIFAATLVAHAQAPYTTWYSYGGGSHSSQYSALDQIDESNVAELEVAWSFPAETSGVFNPIVVDGVMYLIARDNELVALDAATGRELWARPQQGNVSARGINYWQSADGSDRRLVYNAGGFLTATNARTGELVTTFGDNGRIDLREALADGGWDTENVRPLGSGNPGRIFEDLFIVSLPAQGAGYRSTPGTVQAYDVVTGEHAWTFHSVPQPGEHGYDTWPEGHYETAGGVHNWSELTVDAENGIAFIPFGTARYDFFGGDREGDNLFANSLVALDAHTGERLWHRQLVHHDLWDYDLPQAPKLLTIDHEGRRVQVVAQATKQGFLFVFERKTGEPIWPIEERPVPQSTLPGEHSSPTQPFPTKPPPFADQTFTAADINPLLPDEERATLEARLATSRNEGLFTPPSFEGSIQMPGHNGGANWASSAVDPLNGELYIVSKNLPTLLHAVLSDEEPSARTVTGSVITPAQAAAARAEAEAAVAAGREPRYVVPYDFMLSPATGMTAVKPPWSHLTAYDLNAGEIKWRIPNGTTFGPGFPEVAGSHMPRGAPLVTAGGLLFVATASDRQRRAYDRDPGEGGGSETLPGGSEGIMATYEVDGRQYLAVPVMGGAGLFPPRVGGPPGGEPERAYVVFALPR
jgi:quinoprotein glucose dehydrogenase